MLYVDFKVENIFINRQTARPEERVDQGDPLGPVVLPRPFIQS